MNTTMHPLRARVLNLIAESERTLLAAIRFSKDENKLKSGYLEANALLALLRNDMADMEDNLDGLTLSQLDKLRDATVKLSVACGKRLKKND